MDNKSKIAVLQDLIDNNLNVSDYEKELAVEILKEIVDTMKAENNT